jgi:hypothetical protein
MGMGMRSRTYGLLSVVLLGVSVGFGSPSAFAGTTTSTLSPATVAAGKAYATNLLGQQPVPPGATPVRHFSTPLAIQSQEAFLVGNQFVSRGYLIPSSVAIDEFVLGHLRKGEAVAGTGTGNGPHEATINSISVSLPCVNRHVTYCGLQYDTTTTPQGRQELRIIVQIDWVPIVVVKMPTTGVITVTGYDKSSLAQMSSGPVSVVLNGQETSKLSNIIATLKMSGEGLCMEDEVLFKISITSPTSQHVSWSAVGDTCPGTLAISAKGTHVGLDDHSCALWRLVSSFFASGQADATKSGAASCSA